MNTIPPGTSPDWATLVADKADDLDAEMLEIFVIEADERFAEIDGCIAVLSENPSDKKQTNTLKRIVHTLKGSANTTGARKIGTIFHVLEDMLEAVPRITPDLLDTMQSGVDAAHAAFQAVRANTSVDDAVAGLLKPNAGTAPPAYQNTDAPVPVTLSRSDLPPSLADSSIGPTLAASSRFATAASTMHAMSRGKAGQKKKNSADGSDEESLRIATRTLDTMSKVAGEINITRSRVALNADTCKSSLQGLSSSMLRLSSLLRAIELEAEKQMYTGTIVTERNAGFDALQLDKFTRLQELTRRVAEAQNDISIQQSTALAATREIEDAMSTQSNLLSALTGQLERVRQVRVSSIVPLLRRVVRAACRDTGKNSEIFFDADVEIDRSILDKARAALEHLLRNAIAHGIERPDQRAAAGKHPAGTIEVRALLDGGDVIIEVQDDGNGIDPDNVMRRAVDRGLVAAGAALSESEIFDLLFEPGFSTADSVTDIAGRGVGLDVVRSDIASMGGRVRITSTKGQGTTFSLRLPATLAVIAGVCVASGPHEYIIPVAFVDRLVRVSSSDILAAYRCGKLTITTDEGTELDYDFASLASLVGAGQADPTLSARNSVLLMYGDRTALHVDDVQPAAEFVFRPMGPQITASSGLIGSTISSAGRASLILDASRIAKITRGLHQRINSAPATAGASPLIMVVDDSLTVRTVTSRLLGKNGYRVVTAENGLQALERLNAERPDLILLDVEMPIMNGYEALQALRATPALAHLPVIMITSRVGDTHRQRALSLGVTAYLGKPYVENELLEHIRAACQAGRTATMD